MKHIYTRAIQLMILVGLLAGCQTSIAADLNENGQAEINDDLVSNQFEYGGFKFQAELRLIVSNGEVLGTSRITFYVMKQDSTGEWVKDYDFNGSRLTGTAKFKRERYIVDLAGSLSTLDGGLDPFSADCWFYDGDATMLCRIEFMSDVFNTQFTTVGESGEEPQSINVY
jgi:hypothetical protein